MTDTSPNVLHLPARRSFLKQLGLGCGSLALASLLAEELTSSRVLAATADDPLAEKPGHFPAKAKSVIWLFMTGGPAHMDLFDYKPELQKRDGQPLAGSDPKTGFFTTSGKCLASPFKFAQHGQSGSWVSEVFPETAKHVDDLAFIHGYHSTQNNHAPASMEISNGMFRPGFPSLGSWVTYGLGSMNRNLPAFVVMHDAAPRGDGGIWSPGFLPANYQPLTLQASKREEIANLKRRAGMTDAQQRAQLDLLRELNAVAPGQQAAAGELAARIESFELAYRMQMAAPEALEIAEESEATKKLYGMEEKESASFGRQCLLARRLVERGVRFVQVFSGSNSTGGAVNDVPWDGHNDIQMNHRGCAKMTDAPVAGLLADLKQRGLLDSTLVIWGGEFGRTSDSQGSKGRDHNPHASVLWMAGGGVKGGVHYGATDDFGYKAVQDRCDQHDLHATILHLLGLDHTKLTYRHNGRDYRLTDVAGTVLKPILA